MTTRRFIAGGALVLLVTMGAGCGKVTEKVTQKASEKATEKVLEKAAGGDANVDIDSKTGKVKIKDKNGDSSIEYDGEGNMKIKDKDGNSTYTTGKGAKLPADWPEALALPKGFTVVSSANSTTDGNKTVLVTSMGSGDAPKVLAGLEKQLKSAGYEISSNSNASGDQGFYGTLSGTKGSQDASVLVMESDGKITLTLNWTTKKS